MPNRQSIGHPLNTKNMRKLVITLTVIAAIIAGCKKDKEEIDTIYPTINVEGASAFPKQCSIVKRGEKFVFRADLADNLELGSVSVDIHHNFDQHSHSTEVLACTLDPKKTPVNPLLVIKDFPVPAGLKTYQISQEIEVPANVDAGDYHFLIRLTDKSGWQTIKGLSIKVQ